MDDLEEPAERFVEFFRCVEGPSHTLGESPPQQTSEVYSPRLGLIDVSSKLGYLFAGIEKSILVYSLATLQESNSVSHVANVLLQDISGVIAVKIIADDCVLLVQTYKSGDKRNQHFIALNVRKLIAGELVECFNWDVQGDFVDFATFSPVPFLSDSGSNSATSKFVTVESKGEVKAYKINSSYKSGWLWTHSCEKAGPQAPVAVAFSVNGSTVALGTRRGSIRLVDGDTGKLLGTIKEIESGWIPFSVAYLAQDYLLARYENEKQLRHVVWQLNNNEVTGHSALGELLYPSDESEEIRNFMMCERILSWDICVVGASDAAELEILSKAEDGSWVQWTLDEGKQAILPTGSEDQDTFPRGVAVDYTDMRRINSLQESEPALNPMPRLLVLSSEKELISYSLVDDRPGAKCSTIADFQKLRANDPVSIMKSEGSFKFVPDSQQTEQRSETSQQAAFGIDIAKISLSQSDTRRNDERSVESESCTDAGSESNASTLGKLHAAELSNQSEFLHAFNFDGDGSGQRQSEQDQALEHSLSGYFPLEAHGNSMEPKATGSAKSDIHDSYSGSSDPDLRLSVQAAQKPELEDQLTSILVEMREELNALQFRGKDIWRTVQSQGTNISLNISASKSELSPLLENVRRNFDIQNTVRNEVNRNLEEVLRSGQDFEDLSLLSTVLSEQNDERALPKAVQQIDKILAKKEREVISMLNSIESRLEEASISKQNRFKQQQTLASVEVIEQIYSSIRLQGIRIKRVKTMLNSLSSQLAGKLLLSERRKVADLGLSISRLERLSIGERDLLARSSQASVKRDEPASYTSSTFFKSYNRDLSSVETRHVPAGNHFSPENASLLRSLAMRRGRSRIVVSSVASVAFEPKTSIASTNHSSDNAVVQSVIQRSPEANVTSSSKAPVSKLGAENGRSNTLHSMLNKRETSTTGLYGTAQGEKMTEDGQPASEPIKGEKHVVSTLESRNYSGTGTFSSIPRTAISSDDNENGLFRDANNSKFKADAFGSFARHEAEAPVTDQTPEFKFGNMKLGFGGDGSTKTFKDLARDHLGGLSNTSSGTGLFRNVEFEESKAKPSFSVRQAKDNDDSEDDQDISPNSRNAAKQSDSSSKSSPRPYVAAMPPSPEPDNNVPFAVMPPIAGKSSSVPLLSTEMGFGGKTNSFQDAKLLVDSRESMDKKKDSTATEQDNNVAKVPVSTSSTDASALAGENQSTQSNVSRSDSQRNAAESGADEDDKRIIQKSIHPSQQVFSHPIKTGEFPVIPPQPKSETSQSEQQEASSMFGSFAISSNTAAAVSDARTHGINTSNVQQAPANPSSSASADEMSDSQQSASSSSNLLSGQRGAAAVSGPWGSSNPFVSQTVPSAPSGFANIGSSGGSSLFGQNPAPRTAPQAPLFGQANVQTPIQFPVQPGFPASQSNTMQTAFNPTASMGAPPTAAFGAPSSLGSSFGAPSRLGFHGGQSNFTSFQNQTPVKFGGQFGQSGGFAALAQNSGSFQGLDFGKSAFGQSSGSPAPSLFGSSQNSGFANLAGPESSGASPYTGASFTQRRS